MQSLWLLTVLFYIGLTSGASAQETPQPPATAPAAQLQGSDVTIAKQAILLDYDTGTILFEKNADERMFPSSMSKVMTTYMVFEALKDGRLDLNGTLPVSEKAWRMEGSKMFIEVGKQIRVEDLLQGVIVQSGNDATVVFAEGLSGTEQMFAETLNAKAEKFGMTNSHFVNASGWPDPNHYTTARDLSILATHVIRDFPEYYPYYSQKEFVYNNIRQPNRNPLLYRNIGADGMKTGHTEAAGYGLIGSAARNGRRVIMVVNGIDSEKNRAEEATRLIEWGLTGFQNITLFKPGDTVEYAYVLLGESEQVPMTVVENLVLTVPAALKRDIKVEATYKEPIQAPIKKGQLLGQLKVTVPKGKTVEVPLVAAKDIANMGLFMSTVEKARLLAGGSYKGP